MYADVECIRDNCGDWRNCTTDVNTCGRGRAGRERRPRAPGEAVALAHRLFTVTLQLALFARVAAPLFALTQAFVPLRWEGGAFVLVFLAVAWGYWRRAGRVEVQVESGARRVLALLGRQNVEPATGTAPAGELGELSEELAGLGAVRTLRLDATSVAVGRTLAELDLRARTGASVIALTRAGAALTPTGHERLASDDLLALTGTSEAIAAARLVLTAAPLPGASPVRQANRTH